jgi:hypothetical protein
MRVSLLDRLGTKAALLGCAIAAPLLWAGNAAAEAGCPPYGYCGAPTSQYSSYSAVQTGYVVRYRPVRVSGPAVYGYRAMRSAPVIAYRPYRQYYRTVVDFSTYSSPYAGPSVPITRD